MYCEGHESGVKDWVSTVQRLRYKDFQLATKLAELQLEEDVELKSRNVSISKLEELDTVKDFGARMEALGVLQWWRKGMGYVSEP